MKKIGQYLKNKKSLISDKYLLTCATAYLTISNAHAQSGATQSATKLNQSLQAFYTLLPTASKIAGVLAIIGGMWGLYKFYKSQGRDGSVPGGIAGIMVGVGLVFLGGLLNLGRDTLGIENTTVLP